MTYAYVIFCIPEYILFSLAISLLLFIIEHVLYLSTLMMTAGRKKKSRMIGIDYSCIRCRCFGPVQFTKPELKRCEHTMLAPDELQSLVYQDIEHLTMDIASRRM